MQETRYDGSVVLTSSATQEQILAALGDPSNKVVAVHKPGSAVRLPDGREFVAQADGTWVNLEATRAEQQLADAKARLEAALRRTE